MAFDISKFAQQLGTEPKQASLEYINIGKIALNPKNFYPPISPEEADALRESIEANGLLEPLTVVPSSEGTYRLISGHNRLCALRELAGPFADNEKWGQIPCRVLPPMTQAQEMSAIIEANRQRRKTGSILAEEARILTESYVERKKSGEELPGRIRSRVAEALQVHETKLAQLSAIEANLKLPGFQEAWKKGDLSESVAYELSKLPREAQGDMWDRYCDGEVLSIRTVKDFSAAWTHCFKCRHTNGLCPHAGVIVGHFVKDGNLVDCAGCCEICGSRDYCGFKCQYIPEPDSVIRFRAEMAQKEKERAEAAREEERLYNERGMQAWRRLVTSAQAHSVGLDEVLAALGWRSPDRRDTAEMEKRATGEIFGEGNETALYVHPFEEARVDELSAVAELLGVSLDYLFGVESTPQQLPEGQLSIAGYMPGGTTPGRESGLCVCMMDLGNEEPTPMLLYWDGVLGTFKFKKTGETVKQEPVAWLRLPEYRK